KIYLPVHLITAHQVVFHCMHTALFYDDFFFCRPHDTQYSLHIESTVADTCIIRVPLKVIHPVRIYLARNHADDQLIFMCLIDHLCHLQREVRADTFQYRVDIGITQDDFTGVLLMVSMEYFLETM